MSALALSELAGAASKGLNVADCDFRDFEGLNARIEAKTRAFLEDIERSLERGMPR